MPTFEISLSDGRVFHVDAADKDTAASNLQAHIQPAAQEGGVVDAFRQGAANLLGGGAQTNKVLFGGGDEALNNAASSIAPQNQADTTLFDKQGLHPGNIANTVAESAPTVAASVAAAKLMPGPIWAKLLAAGGVGAWSMFGPMAKQAAQKRTGDANATPNSDDMKSAAERAIPEAALMSLPAGGLATRAMTKLGLSGVASSAARSALDVGAMGAASAGANAYDQTVQGNPIDPDSVINSGLQGAAAMAPFAAGHTLGDMKTAVKFRGVSNEDPAHLSEAANRINESANNLGLNVRNRDEGNTAIAAAQSDANNQFSNTLDTIKNSNTTTNPQTGAKTKTPLPQDVDDILTRAQNGLPISDSETSRLSSWSGNQGAVDDLVRLGGVTRSLNGATQISDGLAGAIERKVRPIANPLGAGAVGLTAHAFGGLGYTPEMLAALGGAYGLARFNDAITGNRSRANAFTRQFADGNAVPGLTPGEPPPGPNVSPPPPPGGPPPPPGGPPPPPGSPGLAGLDAMARGMPWGPRNAAPTGPTVPQMNPPPAAYPPWGMRNALPTGPKVPLAPEPPAAPVDLSSMAPAIKDIAKNGDTATLARIQANSPTDVAETPLDTKGMAKKIAAIVAARQYAEQLRANTEAQQAQAAQPAAPEAAPAPAPQTQPEPPADLSNLRPAMKAVLAARMKVLAMQAKQPAAAEDVPSFLPNRGAPAPEATPSAPAGQDLMSLMNSFTAANQAAPTPQAPAALQSLVPKVAKLAKLNGKVTPTIEAKAATPTAPPPEPKIETARPAVAPKVTPPADVKSGDTDLQAIPDFLNRTGKPLTASPSEPIVLPKKSSPLENLNTRGPVVGDVAKYFQRATGPRAAADMPEIPDFLRRNADNSLPKAPEPAVAAQALAKLNGAPAAPQVSKAAVALAKLHNADLKPTKPTTTALSKEELAMSSEDYGDHYTKTTKSNLTPGSPLFNKISQAAAATDAKKMDLGQKLSSITGQKLDTLRGQLRPMKYRAQAEKMRDFLVSKHPDDAAEIKAAMSDDVLKALWVRYKPKV